MAKTSISIKAQRRIISRDLVHTGSDGPRPSWFKKYVKHPVRAYNRCNICNRPRGYMRKFGICRHCFRKLSHNGEIPGVRKASW